MSPEQAMADRDLDHRSDVFSLGCVLYEMIAGQNPFHSADEARMLMRRVTDAPDPLSRHRDGVPAGLEAAVMKALAKEPADRWQGVGEMGGALGAEAPAVAHPIAITSLPYHRTRLMLAFVLVLALGLAISSRWQGLRTTEVSRVPLPNMNRTNNCLWWSRSEIVRRMRKRRATRSCIVSPMEWQCHSELGMAWRCSKRPLRCGLRNDQRLRSLPRVAVATPRGFFFNCASERQWARSLASCSIGRATRPSCG
ncbi:MAG: protein kinase [Gemmatimonadetes bacterium]|nr:protein kinase [Gemmatimonadota bacterium]